jgi:hypothetical protein
LEDVSSKASPILRTNCRKTAAEWRRLAPDEARLAPLRSQERQFRSAPYRAEQRRAHRSTRRLHRHKTMRRQGHHAPTVLTRTLLHQRQAKTVTHPRLPCPSSNRSCRRPQWRHLSSKACSSTSAIWMGSLRCWRCPKRGYRTEPEWDDAHRIHREKRTEQVF